MNASPLVLVAIGSNLGDLEANARKAIEQLQLLSNEPIRTSSLIRTAPVNCPPGSPDFINAAAAFTPQPGETPESLLIKLQSLEKELGRTPKKVLNEARPLDLDLIAFGNETRESELLILPHPRAHLRGFVMKPLAEVAPDFILPGQTKTIRELADALQD